MAFVTGQSTFGQLLDTPQENGESDTALPQDGPSKAEIAGGQKIRARRPEPQAGDQQRGS
jgi:hypothetical protein